MKHDRITAATIDLNSIILGTEEGFIHIAGLDKPSIITLKSHDRAVNDLSIDSNGQILAR